MAVILGRSDSIRRSLSAKKENASKNFASCLMVQQMEDYPNDLCFQDEDESEPMITSQLEQIKLGSDFEPSAQSSDKEEDSKKEDPSNEPELDEVIHVQLRSCKRLSSPPKRKSSDKDKGKNIIINKNIIPKEPSKLINREVDYNVLSHLRKIPAQLSVYEASMMLKDLRETLIQALKDPERYEAHFAERCLLEVMHARNESVINFLEEYLLLGTTEHNHPLYVTAEYDGILMSRILINQGSSVNLMNLRTLWWLSLDVHHLGRDKLMIQGFNEKGQQTLGSCVLPLRFDKFCTESKFHIEAETLLSFISG